MPLVLLYNCTNDVGPTTQNKNVRKIDIFTLLWLRTLGVGESPPAVGFSPAAVGFSPVGHSPLG